MLRQDHGLGEEGEDRKTGQEAGSRSKTQKDRNKADSINDSGKLTQRIRGSR